ncbi:hypothetical protein [Motilimonas pumila]|uniref:MSHA biogenesis protein MshI n=1 Tax=Motilimonas pumila TaxID=2303987 RepID=A0A418YI14_9GAMM|nr:hypothetical protein [Motilimonas pumila]RJG49969.1 hypothetical protein D1Z90_04810 [Motilimonas pumila]
MLKGLFSKSSSGCLGIYLRPDYVALAVFEGGQLVSNKSVSIPSSEQWLTSISQLVSETGAKKLPVSLAISPHFYQQLQVDKPNVPNDELASALPFAIKDLITESVFELAIDYYDVPPVPMMTEKVTVVYSQKSIIQKAVDVMAELDLPINNIATEELALTNLMTAEKETQMLIHQVQGDDVVVSIVRDNMLYFSRKIRGFQALGQQVEPLDTFLMDGLGLELQRSLDYVIGQLKIADVSKILLAVPGESGDLIASNLSETLDRKVDVFQFQQQGVDVNAMPAIGAGVSQ